MPQLTRAALRGPYLDRVAQNRSLERGIEVLRAFRPGADILGNAEIAERTGLAKATVSRLTQTLVASGMLEHDASARAYRLAPSVLSLAHAMRIGSPLLRTAAPLMRAVAERQRVNVGLATADRDAMVYLESVRYNRRVSLRNVVAGQRIPIETTSLGRAYLAGLDAGPRRILLDKIKAQRGAGWKDIQREIEAGIASVARDGFCWAGWQPGVVAVATPLVVSDGHIYALNISVNSEEPAQRVALSLKTPLLDLRGRIEAAMNAR